MTVIQATGLWIALHTLFLIFVSVGVGRTRIKHKIFLGDGENPEMVKAIRAQGNYIEYAPMAMLALIALALTGAGTLVVHIFGGLFLFARTAHFIGLATSLWPMGRMVGTMMTMLVLAAMALFLLYKAFI